MTIEHPVELVRIPVRDLERARAFYESVLDIEMTLFEPGPFRMAWFPVGGGGLRPAARSWRPTGMFRRTAGPLLYFGVRDIEAVPGASRRAGVVTRSARRVTHRRLRLCRPLRGIPRAIESDSELRR